MLSLFIKLNLVNVKHDGLYDSETNSFSETTVSPLNEWTVNASMLIGMERDPKGYTDVTYGSNGEGRYVAETPEEIVALIDAARKELV